MASKREQKPDLLSLTEIAAEFQIKHSTLRYWKATGKFPPPDVPGGPDRWRREKVEEIVKGSGGEGTGDSRVDNTGDSRIHTEIRKGE